jgi:hypothetical protein
VQEMHFKMDKLRIFWKGMMVAKLVGKWERKVVARN